MQDRSLVMSWWNCPILNSIDVKRKLECPSEKQYTRGKFRQGISRPLLVSCDLTIKLFTGTAGGPPARRA